MTHDDHHNHQSEKSRQRNNEHIRCVTWRYVHCQIFPPFRPQSHHTVPKVRWFLNEISNDDQPAVQQGESKRTIIYVCCRIIIFIRFCQLYSHGWCHTTWIDKICHELKRENKRPSEEQITGIFGVFDEESSIEWNRAPSGSEGEWTRIRMSPSTLITSNQLNRTSIKM